MQRHKRLWALAVSTSLLAISAAAYAALAGPTDARVMFQCSGPAGLKIEGTTTEIAVAEDSGSVSITVPLANLSTGIALRDRHMKEKYLEVQTYPTAMLIIARSGLKLPPSGEKLEADVPGMVKIHGKAKTVTVHYDAKSEGGLYAAHGQFHINMNDFGISVPSYLGVTVKPEVDVSASFRVTGS
jgi:polyisoprenoid-binding protein YceI